MFINLYERLNKTGKILIVYKYLYNLQLFDRCHCQRWSSKITSYGKGEKKLKLGIDYYQYLKEFI